MVKVTSRSSQLILFAGIIFSIFLISAVSAYDLKFINGNGAIAPSNISRNINQSLYYTYNITVNNTDLGNGANITSLRIYVPSSFIVANFNGTSVTGSSYVKSGNNITWNNSIPFLLNGSGVGPESVANFWFNASAVTPGTYNISVSAQNITGWYNVSYLTVVVNDTAVPSSLEWVSHSDSTTYFNSLPLNVNFTALDNGVLNRITIKMYNASNTNIDNLTSPAGTTTVLSFNRTLNSSKITEGVLFKVNATVNDTYNNMNLSVTKSFVYDATVPNVTFTCDDDSVTPDVDITCSFTAVDNVDSSLTQSSDCSIGNDVDTSTVGDYTLTCTVTDDAGNVNETTFDYSVVAYRSPSSSASAASSSTWKMTYARDSQDLKTAGSVSANIGAKERMRIKVGTETHNVGVTALSSSSATVEVSSTPQSASVNLGETKMFDLNADGTYDIAVMLQSITNNKASLVVTPSSEKVPVATQPTTPAQENQATAPQASPPQEPAYSPPVVNSSSGSTSIVTFILIVVVAAIIAAVAVVVVRQKKRK